MSLGSGALAADEGPPGRARVDAERATTAYSAAIAAILNLDMRVSPRDKTAKGLRNLRNAIRPSVNCIKSEAFNQTLSCMCKSFGAWCGLRPEPVRAMWKKVSR